MTGIVGAVDGLVVKISAPSLKSVPNPRSYWNRKGGYGMIMQAVAAADATILAHACGAAGGTHDSRAFKQTGLGEEIYTGNGLQEPFFLIGDDAYACTDSLITPFPGESANCGWVECLPTLHAKICVHDFLQEHSLPSASVSSTTCCLRVVRLSKGRLASL